MFQVTVERFIGENITHLKNLNQFEFESSTKVIPNRMLIE